jgi:hypothetical protein
MERPTPELLVQRLASLCPLPNVASMLQARLVPMLSAGSLFISPRTYSRFVVSLLVFPMPVEALALLLPVDQAGLIVGALALVQAMPLVVPLSRANSRKRAAEAELPFFLMTLSVFVHEANPTLQEGFKRVAAIGDRVFPAFTKEGEILARDDAFVPGSPMGVAEKAFAGHPSSRVRACSARALRASGGGGRVSGTLQRRYQRSWRGGPRFWTRSWGGAWRTTRRSRKS